MASFLEMPQASPTMTSGVLLAWHKQEGDALVAQDVVAEVETDKAAMEIEVFDKAILRRILAPAGTDVPAGQPIAILADHADEDVSALEAEYQRLLKAGPAAPAVPGADAEVGVAAPTVAAPTVAAPTVAPPTVAMPTVAMPATEQPGPVTAAAPPAPPAGPVGAPVPVTWMGRALDAAIMEVPPAFAPPAPVVRASPLARKVAAEAGVDLAGVQGSGPHGRVLRADVQAARRPEPGPTGPAAPADVVVPHSRMRQTIATRLGEAWQAPAFYLTVNLDAAGMVRFRALLKERLPDVRVSYNDIVLKCVGRALAEVPEANASWGATGVTRHGSVDLGIAVALDDGLITPIVRDAGRKSLLQVAEEARHLAERARAGKLKPNEYQGATFSVSNLGMMGIEHFTAVLNPPGAGILAVGSLQQEPVVVDGALTVGWRMRATMTCDHRVIDGALGARFLQVLRRYIEAPELLAT